MENTKVDWKRHEVEVMARCAFCKNVLYTESYVDEAYEGRPYEVSHEISGQIKTCPCRKETE